MIRLLQEQPASGASGPILVRAKLGAVAQRMGFDAVRADHMALVSTEILSNQVKYARGSGLFQIWESALCGPAVELFALDYGPGITDLESALADGYTTSGTMGRGLGAITRLADESALYSLCADGRSERPWHGLAVWARFYRERPRCNCRYQAGAFLRAYHDAPSNGDTVVHRCADGHLRWLHLDGLGHGRDAAEAVRDSDRWLDADTPPERLLERIHRAMRERRGAVGLVADLDLHARQATIAGVGDIGAVQFGPDGPHAMAFPPGVLGHNADRFRAVCVDLATGQALLSASDGLRRGWSEETFPALGRYHPQLIALLLGNLMGRANDDKSIFIVRQHSQP